MQTVDPNTVLATIHTGSLQVASVPTSSEPTTPSNESPLGGSLNGGLREWLTELVSSSTNPKVYSKLLVSNAAAGSVIGKAGSNINDVQAKTFARIQLSKANEYFPGTTERTLLVTGRLKQCVAALGLVFTKLLREGVAPLSPRSKAAASLPRSGSGSGPDDEDQAAPAAPHLLVRLLVPQPLCGVIIGKHGTTIRNYAATTNTTIRVTSSEATHAPASHRIVTIAGEQEGVLKAIALCVLKQSEDPKFPLYSELPSPAAAGFGGHGAFGSSGLHLMPLAFASHLHFMPSDSMSSSPGVNPGPIFGSGVTHVGPHAGVRARAVGSLVGDGFTTLTLILTEDQASVLLEENNRPLVEVEQLTGCRARLEIIDGLRGAFGRLVLTGPPEAVGYAQWLLGQRLSAAASFQMGGTTYYGAPAPSTFLAAAAPTPPGVAFMPGGWQPHAAAGMLLAPALQQQHVEDAHNMTMLGA